MVHPSLPFVSVAAQSHKNILQVHGGNIYVSLEGLLEFDSVSPDGNSLVPAHLVGGEHLQPLANGIHHILPAGDIAELVDEFVCGGVFQNPSLIQDNDVLEDRGRLLDNVGGDEEGAACLGKAPPAAADKTVPASPHPGRLLAHRKW